MAKSVIPLKLCQSSNIKAHGYQPEGQILEVLFKNGSSYQYQGVPAKLYAEFTGADSLGAFLGQHIRGQFPTEKVERDDETEKASP